MVLEWIVMNNILEQTTVYDKLILLGVDVIAFVVFFSFFLIERQFCFVFMSFAV